MDSHPREGKLPLTKCSALSARRYNAFRRRFEGPSGIAGPRTTTRREETKPVQPMGRLHSSVAIEPQQGFRIMEDFR
jgi:hypothetical protein